MKSEFLSTKPYTQTVDQRKKKSLWYLRLYRFFHVFCRYIRSMFIMIIHFTPLTMYFVSALRLLKRICVQTLASWTHIIQMNQSSIVSEDEDRKFVSAARNLIVYADSSNWRTVHSSEGQRILHRIL